MKNNVNSFKQWRGQGGWQRCPSGISCELCFGDCNGCCWCPSRSHLQGLSSCPSAAWLLTVNSSWLSLSLENYPQQNGSPHLRGYVTLSTYWLWSMTYRHRGVKGWLLCLQVVLSAGAVCAPEFPVGSRWSQSSQWDPMITSLLLLPQPAPSLLSPPRNHMPEISSQAQLPGNSI